MRSSVSVILSSPPPDVSMSYPDYDTHPLHHHTLLVLVKQVGNQLKSKSFHKLYDRISRVGQVKVCDSNGTQRLVWLNYKREYPVENNDWGDFQTHRRVLGVITIGQVGSQSDLNDICKQHEGLKDKYSSTLYDSRCIILGLNPDGTIYDSNNSHSASRNTSPEPKIFDSQFSNGHAPLNQLNEHFGPSHSKKLSAGSADRDSGVYETNGIDECHPVNGHEDVPGRNPSHSDDHNSNSTTSGGGSDSGSESTSDAVLVEESGVKLDSPRSSVPDSAHNTSNSSLSTTASRLSLQPPSSFKTRALFYPTGDHAVNIESQLQEFVSSLFWVLESKRLDKGQEKLEKHPLLCAPFELKDFVGLDMDSRANKKRCIGRLKKHLADLSLQVGLPLEAMTLYSQASDILRGCNDWLWLAACYEGLCTTSVYFLYPNMRHSNSLQRYASLGGGSHSNAPGKGRAPSINTNSLPTGLDPSVIKQTSKYCLTADEVIEKYREVILHYSKYKNAGVVETEATIKAVLIIIEQRRYLLAADFLANIVFINLQLSDEEKITRFDTLAELYHQIGFHRKASFFRRIAAMRCVAPQNRQPNWIQCYHLLLQTLQGYKVSLDPLEYKRDGEQGWPALQTQILQELVATCIHMDEHALATRHQAFLVCAMFPHQTDKERQSTFNSLEKLSAKCESSASPLVVQQISMIIPPVTFHSIPFCRQIKVMPPTKERKVEKSDANIPEEDLGPFIFSPFTSLANANKNLGKFDFEWVEGDVCEVTFELDNPMSFELKITSMTLLCEGVAFECWSTTVVLPSYSRNNSVVLRGRPQGVGEMSIVGYSTCISGVHSNCKFKFLPQFKKPLYIVSVIPALPCVQIFCNEASSGTGLVSEGETEEKNCIQLGLNAGETGECNIIIHNISAQPVECIDVQVESKIDKSLSTEIFQYSIENLKTQLPIPPGGKASLTLYVYAMADFLHSARLNDDFSDVYSSISGSEPHSLLSGGPSSLPSRHSMANSSTRGASTRRTDSTISVTSSKSSSTVRSNSSASNPSAHPSVQNKTSGASNVARHTLDGNIKLKYSGGNGLEGDYWRVAEVAVNVEVVSSLLVTKWDALPGELPHQCYIVLDLLNTSQHEMDLHYTPSKHLLIEAGESCRVPVPVDRCSLDKVNQLYNLSNMNENLRDPSEVLGEHVASLVELRWILGPQETPGRASLKGITFPLHTHDLITMLPIQWEVTINGNQVDGNSDNSGVVGQILEFNVTLTNTSTNPLPHLFLRTTTFQDHQNGHHNYRLDAKMSTTGATKLIIPELNADAAFTHGCGLIFFTAGVYKVEVSCSPVIENQPGAIYENVTSTNHHHAWKFAPALEITIADL